MEKSKQRTAAQRREQMNRERQQRLNVQPHSKGVRRNKANRGPWLFVGGILVMIAVVVGIFVFIANQQNNAIKAGGNDAFQTITNVSPKLLATVGTGNAKNLMQPVKGEPALMGPNGKPEIFYVGGEFCPFCAAQRWAMIVSLSRFGTFGSLNQLTSSELNISTFSFHGATYKSQYLDFVAVEASDNNKNTLDKLTPEQDQLVQKFDAPPYVSADSAGSIPFIDIANQQVSAGSYYSPEMLANLSYQDIVTQLRDSNSDIAKGMLGTANYLTAAICVATHNQPANVCTADPIPAIQKTLPQASIRPTGTQLGVIDSPFVMVTRRQD